MTYDDIKERFTFDAERYVCSHFPAIAVDW